MSLCETFDKCGAYHNGFLQNDTADFAAGQKKVSRTTLAHSNSDPFRTAPLLREWILATVTRCNYDKSDNGKNNDGENNHVKIEWPANWCGNHGNGGTNSGARMRQPDS
jgi:hypothetical protein